MILIWERVVSKSIVIIHMALCHDLIYVNTCIENKCVVDLVPECTILSRIHVHILSYSKLRFSFVLD